ncbi:MAG: CsgG/HfaB family protein [Gammaproteobacteria bacterium]
MRGLSYVLMGWMLWAGSTALVNAEPLALAVWSFENNSLIASEDVDHFQQTLPDLLLSDLSRYPALQLVDRQNLVKALEEQKLGGSELVSVEDRLKLGRIVGASAMLFGSYVVVDDQIRIDIRLVDVETSLTTFSKATITSLASVETEMQKVAEDLREKLARP